ncbi:transmembrane protein 25 isoform X2 [Zonotrichia leucophrys gambelii]|uniref:transmembrane protein 25 isoform X2 n=1 Tax=Zonotrichia leucophrys gambelii TaxID=257770 RepID=UPI0006B6B811
MGCASGWPGAALALLLLPLLSLLALCLAALEELDPATERQPRTVCTLQEGESRIFTCWVPRPAPGATLAWYLNGQKQEANLSTADTASILTFTGQRSDHQLNCSLTIPTSSESYNTSILLNVQSGNLSISAANSVGITTASLLPTGLLDARVELPVLGVAIGAALALSALLSLGSCAACLACRLPELMRGPGQAGPSPRSQCSHCSSSGPPQPQGTRLPRQTQSLPPNLRLGDLAQEEGASPKDAGASARGEESALLGLENSLVRSKLGFIQLPVSGRIYKVPSMSSDEIWL